MSTEVALAFYEALGCIRDARRPMDKTLHVNCGALTQFHLPSPANESFIAESGPQRWRGEVELLYTDKASLSAAAERVAALLKDPIFSGSALSVGSCNDGQDVAITGPYDNSFVLRVGASARVAALSPADGRRPGSEQSRCVGTGSLTLRVPPGTAGRGARFYEKMLGFGAKQLGPARWAVLGGPSDSQQLVLDEVEGATGEEMGEHVAIYIGNFDGCFSRLLSRGLIFVNPRFKHLDRSTTVEEARSFSCFRFKEVIDIDSGEKLFELEHEVRNTGHSSCPPLLRQTPSA